MTIIRCNSYWKRLTGLMFRKDIDVSKYWIFDNCRSVHTSFMVFPIKVIGLDWNYQLREICIMKPWRFKHFSREVKHIVECHYNTEKKDIELMLKTIQKERLNEEKTDT